MRSFFFLLLICFSVAAQAGPTGVVICHSKNDATQLTVYDIAPSATVPILGIVGSFSVGKERFQFKNVEAKKIKAEAGKLGRESITIGYLSESGEPVEILLEGSDVALGKLKNITFQRKVAEDGIQIEGSVVIELTDSDVKALQFDGCKYDGAGNRGRNWKELWSK